MLFGRGMYRSEDLPEGADALAEDVSADELANVFGPAGRVSLLNALVEQVQQVVGYARDLDGVGLGSFWHLLISFLIPMMPDKAGPVKALLWL